MKKFNVIILCILLIGVLFIVYIYNYGEWVVLNEGGVISNYSENGTKFIIDNEETAVAIGSALLKDYEPDWYNKVKDDIVAVENNGVWTVYNELKTSKSKLRKYFVHTTGLFVQFKEDGEIIRIGVE